MRSPTTRFLLSGCLFACFLSVAVHAEPVEGEPKAMPASAKILVAMSAEGNAARGAVLFASPTSACVSCHRVGEYGGTVGPELTKIGAQRKPLELVQSLLDPQRIVADEYSAIAVLSADGRVIQGYRISENDAGIEMRDSASGKVVSIPADDIEDIRDIGSLMPTNLMATMSEQDKADLVAFLRELGTHSKVSLESMQGLLSHAGAHHPAEFEMPREPLYPDAWPSWQEPVNRDRVYDFYRKQARHFREAQPRPAVLQSYVGLDGGGYGHWGNQSEPDWADDRWNQTDLGSLLTGVFRGDGVTVTRGICVRLSDEDGGLSCCFDPQTLTYAQVWSGGFLKFSSVRHGFMNGLLQDGATIKLDPATSSMQLNPDDGREPSDDDSDQGEVERRFLGLYRHGTRVIFAYRIGDTTYLDSPTVQDGKFVRVVGPSAGHPDRVLLSGGGGQWPETFSVQGTTGSGTPFAVDQIPLPVANPWKALLFCSGHDFLPDGSALVCTMQGDVWHASGIDDGLERIVWRRFASGLFQPLGMIIDEDGVFVIGRDQITRLHDLDGDIEADFYESFSTELLTSRSGHDFTCGLQRDDVGRFYTASGSQGVMRIAEDGQHSEVLATGLRNADGLGLMPDGLLTTPSSEGDWVPASMITAMRPDGAVLNRLPGQSPDFRVEPFFGRPGGKRNQPPEVPMLYLPRGLDNSSGGQTYIDSPSWGSLEGRMVHLSYGGGRAFLLLNDEFDGWIQGAVVPIEGEFAAGVHRGRFHPLDGHLYVSGMGGWGTYTADDGCFQRLRYSDASAQLPVGFHVHQNGIRVEFVANLEPDFASDARHHFAQAWNYRYSGAYGSPEYSSRHIGLRGHDVLEITSSHVVRDGRSLFLEIPDLQRVNQLHLLLRTNIDTDHDLFLTINHMDDPFVEFTGYERAEKAELPHPLLADLSRPLVARRNPFNKALPDARAIEIAAARNLMYDKAQIVVSPGEAIRLTFKNPDAVPHNWALLQPGKLQSVGKLCNEIISEPDAVARHYIPDTRDVLAHTDVVEPYSSQTIYFRAPDEPGAYPYLCTFPGHWMVMNGTLLVQHDR